MNGEFGTMIHTVEEWKVTVRLFDDGRPVVLFISDDHLGNVLRTLSTMRFDDRGPEQPGAIEISRRSWLRDPSAPGT